MLTTLKQARIELAPFIDNGTCDVELQRQRINEALEALTDTADFECMKAIMRLRVFPGKIFSLPFEVEKLIMASVDGKPVSVNGPAYQFISSGPGDLDFRNTNTIFKDLVDLGEHPTAASIPQKLDSLDGSVIDTCGVGMRVIAFSTDPADEGSEMQIEGTTGDGLDAQVGASLLAQGEMIRINAWDGPEGFMTRNIVSGQDGINVNSWLGDYAHHSSKNYFKDITEIVKPETHGYVSLFAVWNSASNNFPIMAFLGKYHPRQTIPRFRWYGITSENGCCPSAVLGLVKLKCVPLVDDTDVLPIDSPRALKLMVQSISYENAGDIALAQQYRLAAVQAMASRDRSRSEQTNATHFINFQTRTAVGRTINKRSLI